MQLIAESKVSSAIYEVCRAATSEFALATQTGLYFCTYESTDNCFVMRDEYYLTEYIVTQVYQASKDLFICGLWG